MVTLTPMALPSCAHGLKLAPLRARKSFGETLERTGSATDGALDCLSV